MTVKLIPLLQINETGQNNQIVTYYEIAHGELAEGQGNKYTHIFS